MGGPEKMTPDYEKCIRISTQASLREMLAPGALVILSPLVAGLGFGKNACAGFAGIVFQAPEVLEAVQGALCSAAQWKDPKTIGHALVGMHAIAVRLMSGGEAHQNIRDVHAASVEAPQRCARVLRVVLQPLISLCNSP